MSELAKADWPSLNRFSRGCNVLGAVEIQYLCTMQLPALRVLDLQHTHITQERACWLASRSWPLLTHLDLSYNHLDAKDVNHIVSGVWPRIQHRLLAGNAFGHGGLLHLAQGDWPQLCKLQIGLKTLERHGSAVLLGLNPTQVQRARCMAIDSPARLYRNVSLASKGVWPNLVTVPIDFH